MSKMEIYSGYSGLLFDPERLKNAAKLVVQQLNLLEARYPSLKYHVAVTGKSGIAMAFAVAMIKPINIVTVRKATELTHGSKIEGEGFLDSYVILDDFVESGETVRRMAADLASVAYSRQEDQPTCLGYIEYARLGPFSESHRVPYVTLLNGRLARNITDQQDSQPLSQQLQAIAEQAMRAASASRMVRAFTE